MRSFREIAFRVRQELANAWLLWNPPRWNGDVAAVKLLDSRSRDSCDLPVAEEILTHRFRLLGLAPAELGPDIRWRRDFVHGQETGLEYFRRIPYLDFARAGDHKTIWELNRHQHLVVLAQAFRATGRREFLEEIQTELESWMDQNPFQRGINWASALEVAFRAISWMALLELAGPDFEEAFLRRWLDSLYQHGRHLERNLSVYFSPNTHLLGEAVALHALGALLRQEHWREVGGRIVLEQMERQVRADGSHFEQSSYYHLYALDLFLLHSRIARDLPDWYREKLTLMAEFLDALVSAQGILPFLGDEDGGRLFHPYGDRRRFALATLESCGMREGGSHAPPPRSRWFPDAGLAVMQSEVAHVIVDAGPFGAGSAGHSHADALSIVAFHNGAELLIDPGTFTYVADAAARDRYRGVAAHNTVSIRGVEQAVAQGPFRWANPPLVELLHWSSTERCDVLDARCRYGGFTHRRSIVFQKPNLLVVVDRVSGPAGEPAREHAGEHVVEQRWLCPSGQDASFLAAYPEAEAEPAERSRAFGSSERAVCWVARRAGRMPLALTAAIGFGHAPQIRAVRESPAQVVVEFAGGIARFPENGPPEAAQ